VRVSPCSGCETGHPSPPFALRSGDNLYVPRTPPAPGPRLRHFAPPPDPYDEWLDGVSDALASGL
ncbi:MAG: hypothetical protein, partial [Olavius algarvensis Gamma 1 endosymbiont]